MRGFEEIQKIVKNFVEESKQAKQQIIDIENERNNLAQERNMKKYADNNENKADIVVLGKQISELGNQSQKLQNKLNAKFYSIKQVVNLMVDNAIVEGIRKIRQMEEIKEEYKQKINLQKERNTRYEMQKQDFYERFGRVPELSEYAKIEDQVQDNQCKEYSNKRKEMEIRIQSQENEVAQLAELKYNFANRNWNKIINEKVEEEAIILPCIEKIQAEEFEIEEPEEIEEVTLQNFGSIEEFEVEEFEPIEELEIEKMDVQPFEEIKENIQSQDDMFIEELAKTIVEQIVTEQTKKIESDKIEEQEVATVKNGIDKIISYKNVELLNIMAKIENREVVYIAQVSDGEEIKIVPTKFISGNVLLKIKEKREEISQILVDYAIAGYRPIDKSVIKKIDPIICQLLQKYAEKYNYDEKDLIYNYAMTFSSSEIIKTDFISITYNFENINNSNLSKTEKREISKICKNARRNRQINVIGEMISFNSLRNIFRRLFAVNKVNRLPEGKY